MKFRKIIVQNQKGMEMARYVDAVHSCWQGVHTITQDGNVFWLPMTFIVLCYEPVEDKIEETAELSVIGKLLDAGNELLRLVVETRNSIFESNVVQSTGEFPDNEEGKKGKAWYEEYASAAAKWLDLQGENTNDTNPDRNEDKD